MRTDVVGLGVVLAMGGLVYGSSRIPAHATMPGPAAAIAGAPHTHASSRGTDDARRVRPLRHASRHSAAVIARHVREAAARHRLPESLVAAVISVESDANPRAVSRRGAVGLMQLMPSTAAMLGVRDAFNPADNVDGGARHLRDLIDRFSGDVPLALAAYNAGAQAVLKHKGVPPYPETRAFVARVLSRAAVAHAGTPAKPGAAPGATPAPPSASEPTRLQLTRHTVEPPRSSKNDPGVTSAAFTDGRSTANALPASAAASETQVSAAATPPTVPAEAP